MTIHTIDCETLESFSDMPERWIDVAWDVDEGARPHNARIKVIVSNEPGSLGKLSTVIGAKAATSATSRSINRSIDFFEMLIDVEVTDVKQLTNIIAALRATSVINSVERARV